MDDARAVMEAAGSERAVLIGYSEGSSLAALFATTHPERAAGLILYGSFFAWDWMAAGRFPTRHESIVQAIEEIERTLGLARLLRRAAGRTTPRRSSATRRFGAGTR